MSNLEQSGPKYDIPPESVSRAPSLRYSITPAPSIHGFNQASIKVQSRFIQGLFKVVFARNQGCSRSIKVKSFSANLENPDPLTRVSNPCPIFRRVSVRGLHPPKSALRSSLFEDGGEISGSTTATLTISPVGTSDAGNYRAQVSNACGTVFSQGSLADHTPATRQRTIR
jgi:hypothetical protein